MSKRCFVIGGTSGYGRGVAVALDEAGHDVHVSGRSALMFPMDVRDAASVMDRFLDITKGYTEHIDMVFYSAGLAIGKDSIEAGDPHNWKQVFETNTLGLMHVWKHALPALRLSQGHFFHVGSIAAFLQYPGGADYCASKAAANSVMKTIRQEALGSGVRTTSLEVGLGNTNFQNVRYAGDAEQAAKHYGTIKQLEPADLGQLVLSIMALPSHVNVDEVIMKPLDQASHGVMNDGKAKF